jgi:hypothetical protein
MTPPGPQYSPFDAVRDRCRALGLPAWRASADGLMTEEPTEPGPAGLWLRSRHMAAMIAAAVKDWTPEAKPRIQKLYSACWLIPVPQEQRGRRTGLLAALALGPWALEGEHFRRACDSAGLDPQAVRAALAPIACFDEHSAARVERCLTWSTQDLVSLTEHEVAVTGFTRELASSYETIDLLYALGRSMRDLQHPERFVGMVCDRLHEHMQFGWLAARFSGERTRSGPLASRLFLRGTMPGSPEALEAAMDRLAARPNDGHCFLTDGRGELGLPRDTRVLAQPIVRGGELVGMLACGDKCGDDPQVSSYEMQLLEAAGGYTGAMLENATLYQQQQEMFLGTVQSLTAAIDAKDRYTCGHSERVARLAQQLALAAGLDEAMAERVHICGLVHDVGKIGVPEAVLCKPGRLTPEEFEQIKLHPEIGHRILRGIPMLADVLPGVLHHHERWDGRGYPHGLRAEAVPLFARVIGLADTFDAMSSTRSYRAAMPRAKVLSEIEANAGAQFDPDLAQRMVKLDFSEYDRLVQRHAQEHSIGLSAAA